MRLLVSLTLASSLIGCTVNGLDEGSTSQSIVVNNKIAANKIAANKIAANKIAANKIAANKIAANKLTLSPAANDLIETADGREVLTYIVSCAVPEGITLVGTDSTNTSYEFFGEIGLVPDWLDHPLDHAGEGWVSACLFARVNGFDVAVPVSLRGPNSALATTPEEVTDWPYQEGAFYGQYFTPGDEPVDWIACRGKDSAQALAAQRECAQPDPANPGKTLCGFNYAGDCASTPPAPRACADFSSHGYFEDCSDQPIFGHHIFFDGHHDADYGGDHGDDHHYAYDYGDDHHGGDHDGHDWWHHFFFPQIDGQVITTFVQ